MASQEIVDLFVRYAHGDVANVKAMAAEHPEILNRSASWDETALEAASHTANREIVAWLVAQGVPLDLFAAIILEETAAVEGFLTEEPGLAQATGAHGIPILFYATIIGNQTYAEWLLAAGADVNAGAGGNTALHGAAWFDQPEMARWLLSQGADPNAQDYQGKAPLAIALEGGKERVAAILQAGGTP